MLESDKIEKNLEECKRIQMEFLEYLDDETNIEENFQNLIILFDDIKIRDYKHELRLFLHMIVKVANHHHRGTKFFSKIERILQLFKDEIKKLPNSEIFNLFKSNKRILLFLIEEKIMTVDEYFVKQIINGKYLIKKYPQYFAPEIKQFMNEKWFPEKNKWVEDIKKELPANFFELRYAGENDSLICELIREDLAKDFVVYVSKNNTPLNSQIDPPIYETNSFLLKKQILSNKGILLIEYAMFFGSIQIFNYLKNEKVELPASLWLDVIHGANAELIHILEDTLIKLPAAFFNFDQMRCFLESIKCHHYDIANYFINNYLQSKDENSNNAIIQKLKYYNFSFLQNKYVNESLFCHFCHYDYYSHVKFLLERKEFIINYSTIQNHIFFNEILS